MSKQNGKKNIVICGAYGFGNVGDEAILESIIASLSMSYPNCNITVLSRNPEEDAKREGVTRAVHSLSLFAVISRYF